ncbi:hypothetical protein QNI19_28505 [Cytophagaceae bacterium DM2B3-1]|uniref:Uncharacterized protein n=1 Tax=Xanthocytophaga flava TaxID=3048013 RepID=A0AAE3UCE7_9BACT|nr:hypothetical protein [Xanthocytophaga flavus]MDJ1471974.1 hypothetical protein [Xanthocytophaga flavus]MDJ1484684.1 hypothetical protein [Xanthocytophaga flavus]MDJ1496911.1 hypothetical protein [Xanthocytophaga flavus]
MKAKNNSGRVRVFLIILLVCFWGIMIRLVMIEDTWVIALLGILSWTAFLLFSMRRTLLQWIHQPSSHPHRNIRADRPCSTR